MLGVKLITIGRFVILGEIGEKLTCFGEADTFGMIDTFGMSDTFDMMDALV